MSTESPFVETEALLAVLNEDEERMEEILREMLPGELATLKHAAQYLADSCRSAIRIKQRETAQGGAAFLPRPDGTGAALEANDVRALIGFVDQRDGKGGAR